MLALRAVHIYVLLRGNHIGRCWIWIRSRVNVNGQALVLLFCYWRVWEKSQKKKNCHNCRYLPLPATSWIQSKCCARGKVTQGVCVCVTGCSMSSCVSDWARCVQAANERFSPPTRAVNPNRTHCKRSVQPYSRRKYSVTNSISEPTNEHECFMHAV